MEACLVAIQLLCTTHLEKADPPSEWRLLFFYTAPIHDSSREQIPYQNGELSLFYSAPMCNSYREGSSLSEWRLLSFPHSSDVQLIYRRQTPLSEWRPISFPHSSYLQLILKTQIAYQNGGFSPFCTAPVYNSFRGGTYQCGGLPLFLYSSYMELI